MSPAVRLAPLIVSLTLAGCAEGRNAPPPAAPRPAATSNPTKPAAGPGGPDATIPLAVVGGVLIGAALIIALLVASGPGFSNETPTGAM